MAINWDLYNKRLYVNGTTKRERDLQSLQNSLTNKLSDSLSYKAVMINNINRQIELVKTSKDYVKVIHSLPNETFDCGDYIVYNSRTYLITEVDNDNEVYTTGQMQLCTHTLKFQSSTGTILSYPCIDETTSTLGVDESNIMTTGNSIHRIKVPFDFNTITLREDRRIMLDKRTDKPSVYSIAKVNTTEFSYGDKGLIEFTLKQNELQTADGNLPKDRPDLGICNYFEPTVTPEPPDPTVPTEIVTITSDATNNEVILGITHTFSATFKNQLGEDVANVIAQYSVDNTYSGKVILVDNGDSTATVTVGNFNDSDLCTKQFTLICTDTTNNHSSSIVLTIVGLY